MKVGAVEGVQVRDDHVATVLIDHKDGDRESSVKLCSSARARCVRPGDFIWTQSGRAMWTSRDLGIEDVRLPIHRTSFDGSHPCGCPAKRELP